MIVVKGESNKKQMLVLDIPLRNLFQVLISLLPVWVYEVYLKDKHWFVMVSMT